MIYRLNISTSISRLAISLLMLLAASGVQGQKIFSLQKDSIPLFRGFQVSFDLVGAAQLALSDYGQYEGAVRLNLHDQWFPIIEAGIGKANHRNDNITELNYKTTAPYFRIGVDVNLMKNKHDENRLYGGIRYAFTSYKVDISRDKFVDPVWKRDTSFSVEDMSCSQHWVEAVFGIDAKIAGPLHLGWSVRYKRRIAHKDGDIGQTWYVPGYGIYSDTRLGATFNVIIDI